MTGLRIGYVLGPKGLIAPMMLAHQFSVACVNGPAQYAAVRALEGPQNFVKDMVAEFDRRRRLLCKRLEEIEGFGCKLPKGAFYVFANIKEFGVPSEHLTEFLLKEGKVVTVPGSAFGEYGEGYLRFSYATAYDKIVEAMDRIEHAVKKFKSRQCSS
jgi:aspartate/methionine/tyrosine aminotransferase